MDSTELNKIAGALIGAFLVFLLLGFFSSQIFFSGHGGGNEPLAYALEIEDSGEAHAEEEQIDYAPLIANADTGAGEKIFSKCKACHKTEDGANGVGPHLYGVVGREIGAVGGFGYSDAMANHGGTWDFEALNAFLASPKDFVPGTKMGFAGLSDPEDRVNIIAWLNEDDGSPIELVAAPVANDAGHGDDAAEGEEAAEGEDAGETEEHAAAAPEDDAAAPAGEASGLAGLLASADADAGKKVFNKCRACHKLDEGANGVGPSLYGVVGREIGGAEGYNYSGALADHGGTWTLETLSAFIEAPKDFAPGTKMTFAGIPDEEDRVNLIVYLNEADGSPEDLSAQ